MTSLKTPVACAALLAALPACGSSGSNSGEQPALTLDEAPVLLEAALGSLSVRSAMIGKPIVVDDNLTTDFKLPQPVYKLLEQYEVAQLPRLTECASVGGEWIDADGDGIPVDFIVEFGCQDQLPTAFEAGLYGNVMIDDSDDANPVSGYDAHWVGLTVERTYNTGTTKRLFLDGSSKLELAAGSLTLVEDYVIEAEVEQSDATYFGKLDGANALKYTPDDDTDPLAAGEVRYVGESNFENQVGAHRLGVGTDPMLHFDDACRTDHPGRPGWDAGAVILEDGAKLRIEYLSCDEMVATLDGVSIGQL